MFVRPLPALPGDRSSSVGMEAVCAHRVAWFAFAAAKIAPPPPQTPGTSTHVPTQQEQAAAAAAQAAAAAAAAQAAAAAAAAAQAAAQQQQQQAVDPAELICFFEEGELASCDACGQRLKAPVRCNVLVCPNCKHHVRATNRPDAAQQAAAAAQQASQQQQVRRKTCLWSALYLPPLRQPL